MIRGWSLCLLLAVILTGCQDKRRNFELSDGKRVTCRVTGHACGVHLYDCTDGNDYYCQTNVKEFKE